MSDYIISYRHKLDLTSSSQTDAGLGQESRGLWARENHLFSISSSHEYLLSIHCLGVTSLCH